MICAYLYLCLNKCILFKGHKSLCIYFCTYLHKLVIFVLLFIYSFIHLFIYFKTRSHYVALAHLELTM